MQQDFVNEMYVLHVFIVPYDNKVFYFISIYLCILNVLLIYDKLKSMNVNMLVSIIKVNSCKKKDINWI